MVLMRSSKRKPWLLWLEYLLRPKAETWKNLKVTNLF